MSKLDDVITKCKEQMTKQGIDCDETLLTNVAKALGPSIYNADALVVATGDKDELQTVKNWVGKKLGVAEGAELDAALERCTEKIGKSNTKKLRPVYYYLLAKDLGKESVFS